MSTFSLSDDWEDFPQFPSLTEPLPPIRQVPGLRLAKLTHWPAARGMRWQIWRLYHAPEPCRLPNEPAAVWAGPPPKEAWPIVQQRLRASARPRPRRAPKVDPTQLTLFP